MGIIPTPYFFILPTIIAIGFGFLVTKLYVTNRSYLSEKTKASKSIAEKEVLVREIHHRVKNNLQIITSLLNLQTSYIKDREDKALFKQSQNRINSMSMIHEMLYNSDNLANVEYSRYVHQLATNLISSFKGEVNNIELSLDIPKIFLNLDTAIPLGLLINEIITNSLKYGIPQHSSGTIHIKIEEHSDTDFTLYIGDNGVGFSKEINSKTSNSLGLSLIDSLTSQLKGSLEKLKGKGTNYKINFKKI